MVLLEHPDASVQPLVATAAPLLPPPAGPPFGVALERWPPLVVVPVIDVEVSVVTASIVSTPRAGATVSSGQNGVSDRRCNGSPTTVLRHHD